MAFLCFKEGGQGRESKKTLEVNSSSTQTKSLRPPRRRNGRQRTFGCLEHFFLFEGLRGKEEVQQLRRLTRKSFERTRLRYLFASSGDLSLNATLERKACWIPSPSSLSLLMQHLPRKALLMEKTVLQQNQCFSTFKASRGGSNRVVALVLSSFALLPQPQVKVYVYGSTPSILTLLLDK